MMFTTPRILSSTLHREGRFRLDRFRTRYNMIVHMVFDADTVTDAQVKAGVRPEMVGQFNTRREALIWIAAQ